MQLGKSFIRHLCERPPTLLCRHILFLPPMALPVVVETTMIDRSTARLYHSCYPPPLRRLAVVYSCFFIASPLVPVTQQQRIMQGTFVRLSTVVGTSVVAFDGGSFGNEATHHQPLQGDFPPPPRSEQQFDIHGNTYDCVTHVFVFLCCVRRLEARMARKTAIFCGVSRFYHPAFLAINELVAKEFSTLFSL